MFSNNPYRKILLADDDEDDMMIFAGALKEADPSIDCATAANGKEVIERLEEAKKLPDIIFLDINMPLVNGFECLAELKKRKHVAEIPVVILSTASNSSAFETAHALGADAFLIKPPTHKELVSKLKEIFLLVFSRPDEADANSSRFLVR